MSQLFLLPVSEPSPSLVEPEQWVQMTEYPHYDASSYGRFRHRRNLKTINPYKGENGYGKVNLVDRTGKNRNMLAHRLIAMVFIPNPSHLPVVDHIDGNRMNCASSNLRWATLSDNARNNRVARRQSDFLSQYTQRPTTRTTGGHEGNHLMEKTYTAAEGMRLITADA